MNRAPGVEMVLLKRHFAVVRSAAGVLTSPGYSMRLLPTVRQVWCVSAFCSWISTTIWPYVTLQSRRTVFLSTNQMVSDPEGMAGSIPCARHPNSLAKDCTQASFVGPLTR